MGYALGGGGRGSGLLWLAAATGAAALMGGHLTALPSLRPLRAVTASIHPAPAVGARPVRIAYRDADGRWRVLTAKAAGPWRSASAAAWRRAMPGMDVRVDGGGVALTESLHPKASPYYLAIDQGRVGIWAGRPEGYHVCVSTTPLLAGTLGPAEIARLRATVRVASVAQAWQVLSGLGT